MDAADNSTFCDTSAPDLAPWVPDFTLAEEWGTGSETCRTYRIKHFGRRMFVKRLVEELDSNPLYITAYRKEFEVGYPLAHPALPRYVSFSDTPGNVYIVSEYVDGCTLSQFVTLNPHYFADATVLRRFFTELLDVVGYLHRNGILHLDIKPDNIMITTIGNCVRLIDLGMSFTDAHPDTAGHTPAYAPPAEVTGVRRDYYAIGKVAEYIRNHTQGYPYRQFARFEHLCLSTADTSTDMTHLVEALRPTSRSKIYIALAVAVVVVVAVFFLFLPAGDTEPAKPRAGSEIAIPAASSEAAPPETVVVETKHSTDAPVDAYVGVAASGKPALATLVDGRLSDIDRMMDEAGVLLDEGSAESVIAAGNLVLSISQAITDAFKPQTYETAPEESPEKLHEYVEKKIIERRCTERLQELMTRLGAATASQTP